MDNLKQPEMRISTFKDSNLEKDYMEYGLDRQIRAIRLTMLFFGSIFLIFLIPDFLFTNHFIYIASIRLTIFTIILICFFMLPKVNSLKHAYLITTLCEVLISIAFLCIIPKYSHPDFMLQLLSLILIQIIFFIIPNQLIYCLVLSIITWIIFMANSHFVFTDLPFNEYLSGIIFPLLFIPSSSYWFIRHEKEKRIQFYNNRQLLYLLNHDILTNIYNRFKFENEINSYLSKKNTIPLTLALLDIDFFKQINDKYGHLIGDKVLVLLANHIQSKLGPNDLLARWGGEEFVILFYNHSLEDTIEKVNFIKSSFKETPLENIDSITCSVGITKVMENDTLDILVNRADKLMYKAKENGRNQIAY